MKGSWTIHDLHGNTVVVELDLTPFGGTEPQWYEEGALTFQWEDGRRAIYSYAGMSSARYVPPTRDSNQDSVLKEDA